MPDEGARRGLLVEVASRPGSSRTMRNGSRARPSHPTKGKADLNPVDDVTITETGVE
jgi:hypothetical protein